MLVNDDYAPQRAEHASLPGHAAVLATEPLQLRAPYYGTVSIAPKRGGLTVQSIPAVAKNIFLDSAATAQCELFLLRRIEMIILTYLLLQAFDSRSSADRMTMFSNCLAARHLRMQSRQ